MSQKEVELILSRHLAHRLATPILLVDPQATLLYFNEPAEKLLGQSFAETGELPACIWSSLFTPTDEAGVPLGPAARPLMIALATCRPAHGRFWVHGLDGVRRHIEAVAMPILGQAERFLGAVTLFWEVGAGAAALPPAGTDAPASSPPVEMILARQLASYLAIPIWIYDPQGTLVFFNEPAEPILGRRFEETGEIVVTDLPHLFPPTDAAGVPIPPEALPTHRALFERRPAQHRLWIHGADGVRHSLEINAFPLVDRAGIFLGVVGLLWEIAE